MRLVVAIAAAAAMLIWPSAQTVGRERHPRETPGTGAPPPPVSRFYPEEIDGGVKGNLPFNNQIRKLKDPLNANGAK